jgi:broad specificity phosphatase PhoE
MTLFIVRHGRTAANAGGLLLGRADPALDDTGREQAAAVARALGVPARIVTSPLRRCRETAAAFGDGVRVDVDERWIELDYGEWDQTPIADLPADTWARWRSDVDLRPPNGESLRELGDRVRRACNDLLDSAREEDVVVVTHVSPYKAALAWALEVGDEISWRLHVVPASISRIGIRPTGPVLLSFNEIAHLG